MSFKKLLLSSIIFASVANDMTASKLDSIIYKHPKNCTAVAVTLATALSVYKYYEDFKYWSSENWNAEIALLKTSLIAGCVGLIGTKFWVYGPKSYLENAKSKIIEKQNDIEFMIAHERIDQVFIEDIKQGNVESQFPLADAFYGVKNLISESKQIVEWLNIVVSSNAEQSIKDEAVDWLKIFDSKYFGKLQDALKIIKKDPEFMEQSLGRDQQRIAQEMRLANNWRAQQNFNSCLQNLNINLLIAAINNKR